MSTVKRNRFTQRGGEKHDQRKIIVLKFSYDTKFVSIGIDPHKKNKQPTGFRTAKLIWKATHKFIKGHKTVELFLFER